MSEALQAFTDGVGQMPAALRPRSLGWMSRGACRQADPELFFPVAAAGPAARQAEAAKAVCGPCAVRARCLSYALEAMPEGVWGGTTLEERRAARKGRQASEQSRCPVSRPAGQDRLMSLPGSQQRALNRIGETLARDHPRPAGRRSRRPRVVPGRRRSSRSRW